MDVHESDRPFRGFLPRKTTPRDLYQSTVIAKLPKLRAPMVNYQRMLAKYFLIALALWVSIPVHAHAQASGGSYNTWGVYGGPDNIHYSSLEQVNRDNVHSLEVAWTFDSGDQHPKSEMECNPIVVDGVLYATTPGGDVVALDAATGVLRWRFNANQGL